MYLSIRIFFITSILVLSPEFGLTADAQLAAVDSRCVGNSCAQAAPAANQSQNATDDFSPTPVQLLLAGMALIAVRIAVKKYLSAKTE